MIIFLLFLILYIPVDTHGINRCISLENGNPLTSARNIIHHIERYCFVIYLYCPFLEVYTIHVICDVLQDNICEITHRAQVNYPVDISLLQTNGPLNGII
jgi:hypothetical protein